MASVIGLIAVAGLITGCGGSTGKSDQDSSGQRHSHHAGMSMEKMAAMDGGHGPSPAAQMICSDEIGEAVARTFRLSMAPESTHDWAHNTFTCDYAVPGGTLQMSVDDATNQDAGYAYFDELRSRLSDARPIKGMENFGFPAFETRAGDVVFIKDGKTLHVDATHLAAADLPTGFSRSEVAYSIASAVIACWTE